MNITKASKEELKQRFRELSEPMECIPAGEKPRLKKLEGIKAVLFDFYGTLFISGVGDIGIDDGKPDAALLLDALASAGIRASDSRAGRRGYEIYNEVVTEEMAEMKSSGIIYPEPDIREVWREVLSRMLAEELIKTAADERNYERLSVEFEARMNPVWPMPGLHETLDELHKKNLKLGIISNSQFYTPIALEALAGKSTDELGFDSGLMHWSFEESRKKPSQVFYEHFLEKAKKVLPDNKPENMLYIGNDMLKDIYPAAELGMKTALFAGDKRSLKWRREDSRCKKLEPDLVVTELKQLSDCV